MPNVVTKKKHGVATSNAVFFVGELCCKVQRHTKERLELPKADTFIQLFFLSVALSLTIHLVQYRVSVKLRLQRNFVDFFNFSGNKVRCATTHCDKPLS